MNKEQARESCVNKEQELLNKYFGNLVYEAAHKEPETIEGYDKELPLRIETEYKEFLKELWSKSTQQDKRTFEGIIDKHKLRFLMTDSTREAVDIAYIDAQEQTLWEKITSSNHTDVTFYKGLLKEYTRELLAAVRYDFLEDFKDEE